MFMLIVTLGSCKSKYDKLKASNDNAKKYQEAVKYYNKKDYTKALGLFEDLVTRYRGRSASTQDFIALASELAGRDLSAFLHEWLYSETTPPMPGHPDWVVLPVTLGAASAHPRAEHESAAQLLRY